MRRADKLKQAIERQIVTGEIRPGERLEEVEIAQRFNVSRTPVREALMMLEAIDLVERRPRIGAVVKGITLKRLIQMMEVLMSLEQLAASLAAKRIRTAEAEALKAAQEACRQAALRDDPDEAYERNIDFHRAIYAGSYNQVLIEQIEFFGQRMAPFIRTRYREPGWPDKSFTEHEGIIEAILKGKADQVEALMEQHGNIGTHIFADFASHLEDE